MWARIGNVRETLADLPAGLVGYYLPRRMFMSCAGDPRVCESVRG